MPRAPNPASSSQATLTTPYPSNRPASTKSKSATASPKRRSATTLAKTNLLTLAGAPLPPYNDWQATVVDDTGRYLYIFGGCPQAGEGAVPDATSDLFSLDLQAQPMQWTDLTMRVRSQRAGHFAPASQIAPRTGACLAFFRFEGRPFLIIFGGWGSGQLSSEFITVDLIDKTWELHPEVSNGILRIEPAMVVAGDGVYVFGGRSCENFQAGEAESTFCVMRLNAQTRRWGWEKKDARVPLPDAALGSQLGAVPWDLGILIVRGRSAPGDIPMNQNSFVNFDPDKDRWAANPLDGELPPDAEWFNLRSAGLPGKEVPHICCWYETTKEEDGNNCIACDIWVVEKGVVRDTITSLKRATAIWHCRDYADLELFIQLRDGRMLMMGKQEGVHPATWKMALDVTKTTKRSTV